MGKMTSDDGIKATFYEKNGRLWVRQYINERLVLAEGPTRVHFVKDEAIDTFRKFISRPEVEKALLKCKDDAGHERRER